MRRTVRSLCPTKKIISGGPTIDEIKVKISPTFVFKPDGSNEKSTRPANPITTSVKTEPPGNDERIRKFRIPGMQDKLTEIVLGQWAENVARDQEPYRDLLLTILMKIDGKTYRKNITIMPNFVWKYPPES